MVVKEYLAPKFGAKARMPKKGKWGLNFQFFVIHLVGMEMWVQVSPRGLQHQQRAGCESTCVHETERKKAPVADMYISANEQNAKRNKTYQLTTDDSRQSNKQTKQIDRSYPVG